MRIEKPRYGGVFGKKSSQARFLYPISFTFKLASWPLVTRLLNKGPVNGKSGTFDFKYVGKAWPAEPGELAGTARIIILSGKGELSNLHGKLDVTYIMGDDFDRFTGKIRLDS